MAGVGRLRSLQPPEPPNRYELPNPGDLLHIDIKKLARIVGGPGHRIHGDRTRKKRGVGYEHVYVCIDDHSRLSCVEPGSIRGQSPCAGRARGAIATVSRRFLSRQRKAFTQAHFFAKKSREGSIRRLHSTLPSRTNGKAERFIQTMLREWAAAALTRPLPSAVTPCRVGSTTTISTASTPHSEPNHPCPE